MNGLRPGPDLLVLLAIGALAYGAVRLRRRGRDAPGGEDEWDGRRPSAAPPAEPPDPGEAGEQAGDRARVPRAVSFDASAAGWAVETHGLIKRFGSNVAVDDVELLVPRGCAFGCLGPNGAGKTTLIRTLLGLTRADGGTVSLLGIPVPAERKRALAGVGAIVDEPRFHPHLTGRQNLRLLAAARGGDGGGRIGPSLARVGLTERADDRVASYSMGMRQRLGVASCLLGDPELLILDEPMNGLDPAGMHAMRTMITSLVDEGRTVVLSSHLLDEVERTCDAVAIVDRGRVVRQGPISELIRGAGTLSVQVDCADPARAARVIDEAGIAAGTAVTGAGLAVTLPAGASRELVAEINRRLVGAGISVYGLREAHASLEEWFLSVTSRLGEPS
jgi:ABC-2 type transport system ATP-binding protein